MDYKYKNMKILIFNPESKFDYLCASLEEGLRKNNIEVFPLNTSCGFVKYKTDEDFIYKAKECDYIFVIWGKRPLDNQHKYGVHKGDLLDIIDMWDKVIYIDGSEWTFTGHRKEKQLEESILNHNKRKQYPWINEWMFSKCSLYFKRECYDEDVDKGIKPLLFSAFDKNFPKKDYNKDIDLFVCFGQNRTGLRKQIEKYCYQLKEQRKDLNIKIENNLPFDEYLECTARSLISIDAWGGGDCNARLFEIPACKTMLMYQKYNISFPYKFEEGKDAVSFSNMYELKKMLSYYLDHKSKSKEIGVNGYNHLFKYHTTEKRVQQLLFQI